MTSINIANSNYLKRKKSEKYNILHVDAHICVYLCKFVIHTHIPSPGVLVSYFANRCLLVDIVLKSDDKLHIEI